MTEVRFPDGTCVRGSAIWERDANRDWRQFGLYLDLRWYPSWPAELVAWPDFQTPLDDLDAADAIRGAFERARSGSRVEVGCAGGTGRTGTVLACMAVLAGVNADDAVTWVRAHYLPDAVETPPQEAWVHRFAAMAAARGWTPPG